MLPCLRQPGDLDLLLDLLPFGATVAELGVFSGDGTRQFLASPKVARIYCVDAWVGGYDESDQASQADMGEAERAFDSLLTDPRVVKVKAKTIEAAANIPNELDLVYLDSDHRYEAVKADLLAWVCKAKLGGLVAGHDYADPAHPGVRQAVNEVIGEPDAVLRDTSWVWRRKALPVSESLAVGA